MRNHFLPVLKLARARIRSKRKLAEKTIMCLPCKSPPYFLINLASHQVEKVEVHLKFRTEDFTGNLAHNLKATMSSPESDLIRRMKAVRSTIVNGVKKRDWDGLPKA